MLFRSIAFVLALFAAPAWAGNYTLTFSGQSTDVCTISFSAGAEAVDGTFPLENGDITAFTCTVAGTNPDLVLGLGDLQYPTGLDYRVSNGDVTALDLQTTTSNMLQIGNATADLIDGRWYTFGVGTLLVGDSNRVTIAPVAASAYTGACTSSADIAGMPAGTFCELTNTTLRSVAPSPAVLGTPPIAKSMSYVIDAWSGGCFDTVGNRLIIFGGGHQDYHGNEIYALDFDTFSVSMIQAPSADIDIPTEPSATTWQQYLDGARSSVHTYNGLVCHPVLNGLVNYGGSPWRNGGWSVETWFYSFSTGQWTKLADYRATSSTAPNAAYIPTTDRVLLTIDNNTSGIRIHNVGADSYSDGASVFPPATPYYHAMTYDASRGIVVAAGSGELYHVNPTTGALTTPSLTGCATALTDIGTAAYNPLDTLTYIISDNSLNMWSYDPDTATCTAETPSGANLFTPSVNATEAGTYGRWRWVPSEEVFVLLNDVDANAFVYRPNSSTPQAVVASFTLVADSTATKNFGPIGIPFAQGDVPTDASLSISSSQFECLATWPDGSCKHGVAAGTASLSTSPLTVDVYDQGAAEGAALTYSDIATAAPTAVIDFGAYGTASLATVVGSAPFKTWYSGPEMVMAEYHTDFSVDAYLHAVFYVTLFADGKMKVRAVTQNAYLEDGFAADGSKTAIATVTIGGTEVYNSGTALTQIPHSAWDAEGWIGGDDSDVYYAWDPAYVISTKMVPNYAWDPSETLLASLDVTYTPTDPGPFPDDISGSGYSPHIGPLSNFDWPGLRSTDERAFNASTTAARSVASFPTVWTGEASENTPKPSDYATWTIGGAGGSRYAEWAMAGSALTWDLAHQPSSGFLPYLRTADPYYLKILGDVASTCYLETSKYEGRSGTNRIFLLMQERAQAWCYRTLGQYVGIAPDADTIAPEYGTLLGSDFAYWLNVINDPQSFDIAGYITYSGATMNPLGYYWAYTTSQPGTAYGDGAIAAFMWAFLGGALGLVNDMDALADETDLLALEQWVARSAAGLLGAGGANDYCYINAGKYTIDVSATDTVDATLWYSGATAWHDVDVAENGASPDPCSGNLTISSTPSSGYWGNGMFHWAYACDHYTTDADTNGKNDVCDGWDRLQAAPNWGTGIRDSGFDETPWGIVPRGYTKG